MRKLSDWDESDLQKLVDDQIQESITLEYKRLAALTNRKEISKDISAFANSAGGRIIYGIQEVNQLPVAIDDDLSTRSVDRETLENVVTSTINPRVSGLVIKPIPLASGATAYVIDIPAATLLAPHQDQSNRYYRRFNFKSVPMEDYEVRDAMRRGQSPHLAIYAFWSPAIDWPGEGERWYLTFSIENLGDEPALYTALTLYVDSRLVGRDQLANSEFEVSDGRVNEDGSAIWIATKKMMVPGHIPLFKGRTWSIAKLPITVPPRADYYIGYQVTCPGFDAADLAIVHIDQGEMQPRNEGANKMLSKGGGIKVWLND